MLYTAWVFDYDDGYWYDFKHKTLEEAEAFIERFEDAYMEEEDE